LPLPGLPTQSVKVPPRWWLCQYCVLRGGHLSYIYRDANAALADLWCRHIDVVC
jgi:hypothetical protein